MGAGWHVVITSKQSIDFADYICSTSIASFCCVRNYSGIIFHHLSLKFLIVHVEPLYPAMEEYSSLKESVLVGKQRKAS